ncbi:MAG: TolB family protein, partial [Thermoleophilia bacterium]
MARPLRSVLLGLSSVIFLTLCFSSVAFASPQLAGNPGDMYIFGTDSPIDPSAYTQSQPAITSVNGRVYAFYNDSRPVAGLQDFTRIFFQDITDLPAADGQAPPPGLMLTPDGPFTGSYKGQSDPAADGDLVVWDELMTTPVHGMGHQIHFTRLGDNSSHVLSPTSFTQCAPDVSGTRVVWRDERAGSDQSDIYVYDAATGVETPVCTDPGQQVAPRIDGDWVVWVTNDNYISGYPLTNDVYARNVVSGQTVRITSDAGDGFQQYPAIRDNLVAFSQTDRNGRQYGMYLFDLAQPEIAPHLISGSNGTHPDIDRITETGVDGAVKNSYRVVWHAGGKIILCDLAADRQVEEEVTTGSVQFRNARILGDRIVWSTASTSPQNIYQNRLGERAQELAERYAPELHFRHDIDREDRNDFEPRPVNLMVDAAEKLVLTDGEVLDPAIQDLLDNLGQDNYLDLPGSPANPFHSYEDDYKNQLAVGDYPITTYARVVQKAEGTGKTVIQYWFNYYYNNWFNNHEGDWEMVEVILNENLKPSDAAYAQHGWPWKKGWNEWGLKKTGTHSQVFVAEGSHASYFFESNALHFLEPGTPNAFTDTTGSAKAIIPAVDMNGLNGGWADFAGLWGQKKPTGCFWCDDGPRGPAFQDRDPWNQPLAWANSSYWKGLANDTMISAFSPVEINLYDPEGRHVGKNASGGVDLEIPGSEYFERDEDHSKNIVIHNADILANYTVKIEGTGAGTMDLKVQAPDFGANTIDNPQYLAVEVSPSLQAELDLTPAKDFNLKVDTNGEGIIDELRPPDVNDQLTVDFTPPAAITDLSISNTTSGSANLTWSATGDDSNQGTALRYDLRCSTEPITVDNWQYATPADSLPDPQIAGSPEIATVSGLDAGTTY